MEKVLFTEEQRYTQWWLWLILVLTLLAVLIPISIGIYQQEVLRQPFGDDPVSTSGLVITGLLSVLVVAVVMVLVHKSRLKTKVTSEALYVCFPPFVNKWKRISPSEIEGFEIRTFRPKREFGGHGIRRRRRSGYAYSIAGNVGLQLRFKSGKKFLIGTQRKQAIESAMMKMMKTQ